MALPAHILVVEDEPRLGELLRLYLEREGLRVTVVADGPSAIEAVERDHVDLVVLDLMLPGLDGEAVLAAIRVQSDIPVLIASAKRSDAERIAGLRMGADDYLAKPFNPHELTARVAAILRRTGKRDGAAEVLSLADGRLVLDPESRQYTLAPSNPGDEPKRGSLTPSEAALLGALARRPGSVLGREHLLELVTRRPDDVYDRVIDVHVANLRRKLGDDPSRPWLIETIPQAGYRLVASRDRR